MPIPSLDSTPKPQSDAETIMDAVDNPPKPNDNLKKANERYNEFMSVPKPQEVESEEEKILSEAKEQLKKMNDAEWRGLIEEELGMAYELTDWNEFREALIKFCKNYSKI